MTSPARQLGSKATDGRKNAIINGGMAVAQRPNYVHTASAIEYGQVDRMRSAISATSVSAVSLQAPYSAASSGYAMQIGNVATTGSTDVSCITRLESKDTKYLNGKPITVSVSVNQNSGVTQTAQVVIRKAGAVDNFATDSLISVSAGISVPSGVNTKLTHTITLGATDGDNGIAVSVYYQALPAQSNTQFYFYDFQLEKGSVATDFEQRPIGEELALCQRYYQVLQRKQFNGNNSALAAVRHTVDFPNVMRTDPSATFTTGSFSLLFANTTGICFTEATNGNYGWNITETKLDAEL